MEIRAALPVSLPVPNPTISYWQDPPSSIADFRSAETLPEEVDTVIIGSGITGTGVAWNLLKDRKGGEGGGADWGRVLMLEARGACSGATGRNGGHTKAASYRTFPDNVQAVGLEQAKKIARLELANIRATHAFAKAHNIQCESRSCETVDIIYDDEQWRLCQEAVRLMKESFTEPGDEEGVARYKLWSAEEASDRFFVKGEGMDSETIKGAVTYEAGSISAYAFVTNVLKLCLERGLELYTHTAAARLDLNKREVVTTLGKVRAKRIVIATNGYTSYLIPQFQGKIVPLRGQITAHRPGVSMPAGGLRTTYSFVYRDGYEYMIPRPKDSPSPGDIIIGGGLAKADNGGVEEYGTVDDSTLNGKISAYLHRTTDTYFGEAWGEDDKRGRVRKEWTGIMGYSPDGFPYVGRIPRTDGIWIAAAFQGHGMVFCWESARALVGMIAGDVGVEEWFPDVFKVKEERMEKVFEGRLHARIIDGEN